MARSANSNYSTESVGLQSTNKLTKTASYDLARANVPYITVWFGDIKFTWGSAISRLDHVSQFAAPDYFVSLTHNRYCEQANTGTLTLTNVPVDSEDANKLEVAIYQCHGQMYMQYGYMTSTGELKLTPCYSMLLASYSTSFSETGFTYTIQFCDWEVVEYDIKEYQITEVFEEDNVDYIIKKFEEIISDKYFDSIGTNGNQKYYFDKKNSAHNFKFGVEAETSIEERTFTSCKGVFDLLHKIVSALKYNGRNRIFMSNDPTKCDEIYYILYVGSTMNDDPGSEGIPIRIIEVNSNTFKHETTPTFEWGTKDSTILNWSPSLDLGAYFIAMAQAKKRGTPLVQTSQGNGNINDLTKKIEYTTDDLQEFNYDKSKLRATEAISVFRDDEVIDYQSAVEDFSLRSKFNITASMEVLGIANEDMIPGATFVDVLIMTANTRHYTSGRYLVTKITDNVNSRGFTTTLNLVKKWEYQE